MEQILIIDEREVAFKADGATPLRYRAEFRRDYFADIVKMTEVLKALDKNSTDQNASIEKLDTSVFSDIVYLLAKTADKEIGNIFDWYASFENFPIFEVFSELQDLLLSNMQTSVSKVRKK